MSTNSNAGPILGIDPGLNTTGYAVLASSGATAGLPTSAERAGPSPAPARGRDCPSARLRVLEAGVIRSSAKLPLGRRLLEIHAGLTEVLAAFHPAVVAVEQLYSVYKHPRTAILMAHARGAIYLAAAQAGIPIASYAPTRIKKTLTGSGHAPKRQIQRAIQAELGLNQIPEPHDVADALAVALCHYHTHRAPPAPRTTGPTRARHAASAKPSTRSHNKQPPATAILDS